MSMKKKLWSLALAVALAVGCLTVPGSAEGKVVAAENKKTVMSGTSGISEPSKNTSGTAKYYWLPRSYVYYGSHDGTDVKWRVLDDEETNTSSGGMFLLSESVLDNIKFDEDGKPNVEGQKQNYWPDSDAQKWCKKFYSSSFSKLEQEAVITINKTEEKETLYTYSWLTNTLSNDSVFFISAKEASMYLSTFNGISSDKVLPLQAKNKSDKPASWWLRSPISVIGNPYIGYIQSGGGVQAEASTKSYGARPATNLDLSKILLCSAAEGGKNVQGLADVTPYAGKDWKLTLLDENRAGFKAHLYKTSTGEYSVVYSGAATGVNEYLSAVVKGAGGVITKYGRLAKLNAANGTVAVDLGEGFALREDETLYLFNEQYNGDKKSDYASAFLAAPINTMYTVTATELTDVRIEGPTAVIENQGYSATLVASEGYMLPETITVSMGGTTLDANAYTYNPSTGKITINAVSGDVVISATAVQMVSSFTLSANQTAFEDAHEGYTEAPSVTTTVENAGNQALTGMMMALTGAQKDCFVMTPESDSTTLAVGGKRQIVIEPKANLTPGTYSVTLEIGTATLAPQNTSLSFTVTPHEGGSASCTLLAVCDVCKKGYGPLDKNNHLHTEWRNASDATAGTAGYSGDLYCSDCNTLLEKGEILPAKGYLIKASAGEGGFISPKGSIRAKKGTSKTFTITPDEGYEVADVLVDGESVGALTSYTFEKIAKGHSIAASFAPIKIEATNPYQDVSENDWFYDDVMKVTELGLMTGVDQTSFAPYASITRGMMATILWRMEGCPKSTYQGALSDVAEGAYYSEAIQWCLDKGVYNGYGEGIFKPNEAISREQQVAVLYNYTTFKGGDTSKRATLDAYKDVHELASWSRDAMAWAVAEGLVTGTSESTLSPKLETNRATAAVLLNRLNDMQ